MPLDPEVARSLAARLDFYRELGIYDFYQRGSRSETPLHADAEPLADAEGHVHLQETESEESAIAARKTSTVTLPAPFAAVLQPGSKAGAMISIRNEIGECTRCKLSAGRNKIVFGDGDVNARLMFVGEGPGADEDAQGVPFVGRAGQLLNNMITAMGLKREQVYIANVVKCRPPQNRVPEPEEAHTCMQFLHQQIEVVRPEVLVAMGSTAATYLLAAKASLSSLRGRIHNYRGTRLIVTYHPAFLLRDPRQKKEAWRDLQMAMAELGLKPPTRSPQE
ncbi:MAG: uracil-DNA glycosylase [Acidobacteriaceae bacterium]